MLEIRVRLLPFGSEIDARDIACLWIANRGGGTRQVADYDVYLVDPRCGGEPLAEVPRHRRGKGPWPLLKRAIAALEKSGAFDG